jgi:hypothetical protein
MRKCVRLAAKSRMLTRRVWLQGEIPRISAQDITPEEFEVQYVKRGMPVVLTVRLPLML